MIIKFFKYINLARNMFLVENQLVYYYDKFQKKGVLKFEIQLKALIYYRSLLPNIYLVNNTLIN